MRASKNGINFHVPKERIMSFKSKAKFIESQVKEFERTSIDIETVKEVSGDMYDSVFPPKEENK